MTWRGTWRWTRRVLLAAAGLVAVVIVAALIALHTDWGRERLRRQAVAALHDSFPGGVAISGLAGSVLGDLELRDVVLCDASGRPAISARRVRLNLGYLALLRGAIELESLDVDGVEVRVEVRPGQPVNLATIYRPSPTPLTWDVALPRVRVRDVDITIGRAGRLEHVDDVAITGSVQVAADGPLAAALTVTGVARERGRAPLIVDGSVWLDATGAVVPVARVALGDTTVAVAALSYRAATPARAGAVRGALSVRAPDGVLAMLTPELGLAASIDAAVAVELAVRPDAAGLALVDGTIIVAGSGATADIDLDRLDATITITDGTAVLDARAASADGTRASARGRATIVDRTLVVDGVRVEATVPSLARASRGRLPVDGAVAIEVDASARITTAATTATARAAIHGRDLTGPALPAGGLDVDVHASGETSGPLAIDLDVRNRTQGWHGVVDGQVQFDPAGADHRLATVTLGRYRFELAQGHAEGRGGTVVIADDRTTVQGLRLRDDRATLAVDGTAGRGPRAGQLDGQVTLRGLDLTLLHGLPGVPAGLAGRVDATIDARGGGRGLAGKLAVNATALVVRPGSIPVDVTATADLGPHGLRLGLAARGHALGSLAATARLTPPRRLEDRAAWRRLKRTAIDELQVRARALDLARLAELAGGAPRVEGMVDADVDVTGAGGTIAIHGRGLIVAGAPTPLDLDLDVDLADPANVAVVAHGTLRELGAVTMTTALALPARPFDPGAWRALDLRSLRAIDVTVDEVIVDEARARRLGLADVRGRLAATIHVEPGLAGVTAHVDGRDLIAGRLARPATITVDSRVDRAGTHVTLAMGLGGRAVATGELTVPLGLDRMTVGALDLGALPLSGTFEIARTPIGALMGALGQARGIGGQVHGHLDVAGSVGAPSATVALVVDDLGGRGRLGPDGRGRVRAPLHTMAIDARYQDGAVDGSIRGEAADGGSLAMVVDFDPAAPAAARVSLIAHRFQLGPLARLLPAAPIGVRGVLDADLQLRGLAVASARLGGEARVTGFQVPLADTLDALRDGTLDVTLRGDDLRVNLAGTVGSGQVKAVATAHLVGLIPDRGDLDLTVDHLELITASAPQLAGTIHLEVARDHDRYRAVARIHDAEVVVPERAGRLLHPASLPPDLIFTSELRSGVALPRSRATALRSWIGVRPTHPVLQLAVHIERVTVVSDQLRGDVTGELAILAGDDGAVVDGRIGVSRGKVMLFERRYGVRRADVAFDGGIDPLLDIQLEYEFPQLTMRIALGGRLSKPVLHLSADPNTYTEGQLLAILLGGSPGTPGSENPAFVSGVAAAAASQLVGGYVARKLPVRLDVINYEGVTAVSSSAFVVGRWITSEILLLLRIRIDARPNENVNEAEVELWLAPHLLFEGTAGDRGVLGADLLWNRRW